MSETVADFLIRRLAEWGIQRIYGYPGDGINGIMGALDRAGIGRENTKPAKYPIGYVQVRHEEMAAFMACAHSKFTGEVGVCLATSGPGAIHLLNGLYDAKMDHQAVVAIVGQQARRSLGGHYQQEVDLNVLFKDVASEYLMQASVPEQVRTMVDRAVRIAKAERTVTCIVLPNDLQELDMVEEGPRKHGTIYTGVGYSAPRVIPKDVDLRRAAEVLNAGTKVAMLVGAGALGAAEEVQAVADALGAGISKALLGKAVLPDDAPGCVGSIGLLGTKPSWDLMMDCDTLLMVGSSFPYSEFLPRPGDARCVQIDLDPKMLSIRYPAEVPLCGDAAETLRALLPLLTPKTDHSWRETVTKGMVDWEALIRDRAMLENNPSAGINPERVFLELSPRLPDNCILSADSGSSANWYARYLKIRKGMMGSLSGTLATMGPGVPYAIAAKFAWPDRVPVALVGDGAMLMNGINELVTIANYWKDWSDPRLVILVLNNRDLNQVTWEQRVMEGDPKYRPSQEVPDFPYAKYAEMIGLHGIRVDKAEDVGAAWDEVFAARKPVVLEAYTDPEVPNLPPHISLDQAMGFATSTPRDGAMVGMIKGAVGNLVENFLPHKK